YEIRDGHRRFTAATEAGLKEIPCVIRDMTDEEALEVTALGNLNRRDLTVMEESELLQMLVRAGWKYKDIAAKFGKTERWVSRRVGLARLDARCVEQYENPASPVSTWTIGHLE